MPLSKERQLGGDPIALALEQVLQRTGTDTVASVSWALRSTVALLARCVAEEKQADIAYDERPGITPAAFRSPLGMENDRD